ncbi:MAG: tyrosine-type recombinase/integrase, partial [Nannocystaceae bacterium]
PSTIYNKKKIINTYLLPNLGDRRLDAITEADVARMKARYAYQAPASVNNILTLLGTMLKTAIEWGVIEAMPRIRKLKQPRQRFDFYDEATFERLVDAAAEVGEHCLLAVLLGGDAGLRGGEIAALRLVHCDVDRGVLHICENFWRGHVHLPKGNRPRQVVMTSRLRALLAKLRAERGDIETRVVLLEDGRAPVQRTIDRTICRAQKAAGLPPKGPHILRHTFCSRLAAKGATPKAIKELAGHASSTTTDRYMHLAPGALRTAIALIEDESA